MRKRREWLEGLKMWALIIPACTIGGLPAIYLHESFRQWEAPAVFISLGLGILPTFWYWRARRYGWVIAFIAMVLLTFSTIVAIFHGWETQVTALYLGAAVVFIVVVAVHLTRALSHLSSAMREIGSEVSYNRRGMFFHDDGQRIVVYPRRYRLVINCLIYVVVLLVMGIFAFFILRENSASTPTLVQIVAVLGLGLFATLILNYLLAHVYRLVVRKPSLVIGPDGILDDGSFIWAGVGLVRWDEFLEASPDERKQSFVTYHYLSILVTDLLAIRLRITWLKRHLLSVGSYKGFSELLIPQWMLEPPVAELAEQIDQYVTTHAPVGWFGDEAQASAPDHDGNAEA